MAILSHAEFQSLLSYEPDTGLFRWRVSPRYRVEIGAVAGTVAAKGYRYLKVKGREYRASRVAWLFVHAVWPPAGVEVDHINGDRADDRIANLRLATGSENCRNRRRSNASTTGVKGVSIKKGRFVVRITTPEKRRLYVGSFGTPDEARAAYAAAAKRHHGEFARVG